MIIERRVYDTETCELIRVMFYDDSKYGMNEYNDWMIRAVQFGAKVEKVTGYDTIDVRMDGATRFHRIDVLTEEEAREHDKEFDENGIQINVTNPVMFL